VQFGIALPRAAAEGDGKNSIAHSFHLHINMNHNDAENCATMVSSAIEPRGKLRDNGIISNNSGAPNRAETRLPASGDPSTYVYTICWIIPPYRFYHG
jgi:hypothetical protein